MTVQPGSEPADQLSQAMAATGELIAALRPQDWQAATICTGWQVTDVVQHLVTGQYSVAAKLAGQPPAAAGPAPAGAEAAGQPSGAALAAAYRDSAAEMLTAFRQPGALQQVLTVPFGTVPGIVALNLRLTELLVHGWDIAQAAGVAPGFPAGLAEQALAFTEANLASVPPDRRPFAPPQPAPDSAPAIDRLAALLGRPVTAPPVIAPRAARPGDARGGC